VNWEAEEQTISRLQNAQNTNVSLKTWWNSMDCHPRLCLHLLWSWPSTRKPNQYVSCPMLHM